MPSIKALQKPAFVNRGICKKDESKDLMDENDL